MVLIARKGAERAVLAESQPSATWDSGSGSDPAPMSDHGAYHCAVAIFGSRASLSDELKEWIFDLHQPSKPIVRYHHSAGMVRGGETMTAPVPEYSTHIYEMMARLGIEPGAGVLPRLSLRYATALHRCENCRSKKACQDWLDYAPAMINFAPDFCVNADILFELQYDQPWSRRVN
jgi:hypothetical protein